MIAGGVRKGVQPAVRRAIRRSIPCACATVEARLGDVSSRSVASDEVAFGFEQQVIHGRHRRVARHAARIGKRARRRQLQSGLRMGRRGSLLAIARADPARATTCASPRGGRLIGNGRTVGTGSITLTVSGTSIHCRVDILDADGWVRGPVRSSSETWMRTSLRSGDMLGGRRRGHRPRTKGSSAYALRERARRALPWSPVASAAHGTPTGSRGSWGSGAAENRQSPAPGWRPRRDRQSPRDPGELLFDLRNVSVAAEPYAFTLSLTSPNIQVRLRLATGSGHAALGIDDEVADQSRARQRCEGEEGRGRIAARARRRSRPRASTERGPVPLDGIRAGRRRLGSRRSGRGCSKPYQRG